MSESEFGNRLKGMQDAWTQGREAGPGVPNGIYTFQLQGASLGESQAGKVMITRKHLIVEGDYQGEAVTDWLSLETDFGPKQIARWIDAMGYEVPEDVSDLEDTIAAIASEAPTYTGQLKNRDDFVNIRVRELVEDAGGEAEAPAAGTTEAEGEEPEAGETEFSTGDSVTFSDDEGNVVSGTIQSIDGADAKVQDEANDLWEVPLADLTSVESEAGDAGGEGGGSGGDLRDELVAFAQSQDIDVDDDDTVKTVTAKIKDYTWDVDTLTPDEKELLDGIGAFDEDAPEEEPEPEKEPAKKTAKKTKPKVKPKATKSAKKTTVKKGGTGKKKTSAKKKK